MEDTKERVLQFTDDSNFRRLGLDVNDEKFREDYFRNYRDPFTQIVGNGPIPMASVLELYKRHRSAKKRLGRPPKKKEPALA